MFIEKVFGNTFGLIWLIVFALAILALLVWYLVKTEKSDNNQEKVEGVEESVEDKEEETIENDKEETQTLNKDYEIIESEDGFFRVRKVGNERTLRKFSTMIEAEDFISKRGL